MVNHCGRSRSAPVVQFADHLFGAPEATPATAEPDDGSK